MLPQPGPKDQEHDVEEGGGTLSTSQTLLPQLLLSKPQGTLETMEEGALAMWTVKTVTQILKNSKDVSHENLKDLTFVEDDTESPTQTIVQENGNKNVDLKEKKFNS